MRQTIALIVSIVLGLVAVFAMRSYISKERKEITKDMDLVEIVVADRPLAVGEKLSAGVMRAHKIPVLYMTPDMIQYKNRSSYEGKEVSRAIPRKRLILKTDFRSKVAKVASTINANERLVTIPVSSTTGVAGLIKPRSKVDILYQGQTGSNDTTSLLLSRVRVFATDTKIDPKQVSKNKGRSGYSSLTLLVSPAEAKLLVAAQTGGRLIFTLRSDYDADVLTDTAPLSSRDISAEARKLNNLRVQKANGGL